jgi:hypothetical protein
MPKITARRSLSNSSGVPNSSGFSSPVCGPVRITPDQIAPLAIYTFVDKVSIYLWHLLPREHWQRLPGLCHGITPKPRFNLSKVGVWRYDLFRPSPEALALFSHGAVTFCEIALEWILASQHEADLALDCLYRHFYVPFHRESHRIVRINDTVYFGPRRLAKIFAAYSDRPSKLTGEFDCCRLEWRLHGARAVRNAGIESPEALISFDHRGFWQPRLRFIDLNLRDVGRRLDNAALGTRKRSRIATYGRLVYDYHIMAGGLASMAPDRPCRAFSTATALTSKASPAPYQPVTFCPPIHYL